MSEDPGHKAMLYFLEVLMNSNGPLTISQLAGRFGSRTFSSEMRAAAGGNESGLKKFFLKYPSLFEVNGNMVSLFDSNKSTPAAAPPASSSESSSSVVRGGLTPSGRSLPDVSMEMEAVRYFQNRLMKKEERWVPIRSLAGHLSQAASEVRNVVGPQLEFDKWLLKHPHIFEVQGELVGVRDGIAAVSAPALRKVQSFEASLNGLDSEINVQIVPPKTPPSSRKLYAPKSPNTVRRSHSFSERLMKSASSFANEQQVVTAAPTSTPNPLRRTRSTAPVTMTANEYKAVMFLKEIIEKKGPINVNSITAHFSAAAEGVRNTIGWTKMELEEFLTKNAAVFSVSEEDTVTVNKNAKLNVIITGSRPSGQITRTLSGRNGVVFHVAKLWGIIDLGKHEHVFFDKSIMRRPMDDLQKHFKIGETLHFNAVLATKTSRAKWRATHVWKETESEPGQDGDNLGSTEYIGGPLSPAESIEDEINRFLPQRDRDNNPYEVDDIPEYRRSTYILSEETNGHLTQPELIDVPSSSSSENSSKNSTPTHRIQTRPRSQTAMPAIHVPPISVTKPRSKFVDAGCQTVSTGEIIATQLYQEDH